MRDNADGGVRGCHGESRCADGDETFQHNVTAWREHARNCGCIENESAANSDDDMWTSDTDGDEYATDGTIGGKLAHATGAESHHSSSDDWLGADGDGACASGASDASDASDASASDASACGVGGAFCVAASSGYDD